MKTAYINGNIYSMETEGDKYSAFVVEEGKFLYCGDAEGAKALGEKVVDLQGATVLPGMIDTHQHLLAYARDLLKLNLKTANSFKELLALIKQRANKAAAGEWILGVGFDHEKFQDKKTLPTKEELDRVCPHNPLIITRYCLHVNVANSLALAAGGIDRNFKPEVAGTVDFDLTGEPTGVLKDKAAADIIALVPDPLGTLDKRRYALGKACHELNSHGLTGVHPIRAQHCSLPEYLDVYQDLADEGCLTTRVYLGFDELPSCGMRSGLGNEMVKYGFYKLFVDGNMGGRTALLSAPYEDDAGQSGVANYTQEELTEAVKAGYARNIQVGAHVIGDRAAEMFITAIEETLKTVKGKADPRFRVIHASLLNPQLVDRMAKLPIIVDIQPMFVCTNVHWSQSRVGAERSKYHYCWRTLLNRGLILTAGSDSPCESYDPMDAVYAITTRQGVDGYPEGGWMPQERVTIYEALAMYTKYAAYASYEEDIKGTIAEGKLADFVVLNQDVFKTRPEELRQVKVEKTYLGGTEVYVRKLQQA